jgi:nucleotide-binding universal stress UspA family protein
VSAVTAKQLVVGVDGTAAGVAALRWAVDQARGTGAQVLAIAVCEPLRPVVAGPEIGGAYVPRPVLDDAQLTTAAEAWLTDAITALPGDAAQVVDRQTRHGDAATVLLEAARDADLLVVGNHGRGALAGALARSVALRCAHHARCPLVLVPAPEEG